MLFLCNPFITSGQALIAGTGTFTVLGREALFNTSILQVSEAGSFALSGQAADFRRNLIFEAAAGAIALDGQIVTMIYGKGLLAEVGAFTVTGNEAAVLRALLLEAGTGSFAVTGEDADFVRHLTLAAEPGLFSLSGQTADFRAGVNLGAEAGLFTLTGQEASIARGAVLQASAGAYALNGQGVTLRRALRLQASMGSFALTGQDVRLALSDPHYSNVSLLLHCDGADGSTTFTDSGPLGLTVTPSSAAQIDTAQSKFGGASALFDGVDDRLRADSSGFNFGTGDFTVECWVNTTQTDLAWLIGLRAGSATRGALVINVSGSVYLSWAENDVGRINANVPGIIDGNWHHVAVTRSGNSVRMFLDGTQVGSTFTTSLNYNSTFIIVGNWTETGGSNGLNGWLDDVRVTKGVARYTANFTVPNSAFPDL